LIVHKYNTSIDYATFSKFNTTTDLEKKVSQSVNCIFCKIVSGQAPALTIYEDEYTLGFMDIYPASRGHVLVISKQHYTDLFDIDPAILSAVAVSGQRIARAVDQALHPDGFRITQFNRAEAGQSVFHYHVHIRPVYAGQGTSSHGRGPADTAEIERIAGQIQAILG
jgi:histidine triad (HIT) family protein